jgi:hypothetical protein
MVKAEQLRFAAANGNGGETGKLRDVWNEDGLVVLPSLDMEEQVARHALVAESAERYPAGEISMDEAIESD